MHLRSSALFPAFVSLNSRIEAVINVTLEASKSGPSKEKMIELVIRSDL